MHTRPSPGPIGALLRRSHAARPGAHRSSWAPTTANGSLAKHLLRARGCQDAGRVYIRADKDQRTLETGRAFAESILPGCGIDIHSQPEGGRDPLFSGAGTPDPERSLAAVRERLGPDPQKLLADHRAALRHLQFILARQGAQSCRTAIGVGAQGQDRSN